MLGYPRLSPHNPQINWTNNRIDTYSPFCLKNCLQSALPEREVSHVVESDHDLSQLSSEYHNLSQVFRKDLALSLSPHRPYKCVKDLQPGAPLPFGRLYNPSLKGCEAMEQYIPDS